MSAKSLLRSENEDNKIQRKFVLLEGATRQQTTTFLASWRLCDEALLRKSSLQCFGFFKSLKLDVRWPAALFVDRYPVVIAVDPSGFTAAGLTGGLSTSCWEWFDRIKRPFTGSKQREAVALNFYWIHGFFLIKQSHLNWSGVCYYSLQLFRNAKKSNLPNGP